MHYASLRLSLGANLSNVSRRFFPGLSFSLLFAVFSKRATRRNLATGSDYFSRRREGNICSRDGDANKVACLGKV